MANYRKIGCCPPMVEALDMGAIDRDYTDGTWVVPGCCGGCWVLQDLVHCPFCGKKLETS